MLTRLSVSGFKGVPYLESSLLMQNTKGTVKFAVDKPNVLIGPNGSGKSALLNTIAIRFLAYFTPRSSLNSDYTNSRDSEDFWVKGKAWYEEEQWLPGLTVDTDNGPIVYYRPSHIPGNEVSVTHAMMTGYFDEAKAYARLTEKKSSGQKAQVVLDNIHNSLAGIGLPQTYECVNWNSSTKPRSKEQLRKLQIESCWNWRPAFLANLYQTPANFMPVVVMDEPEQSLDALAEANLWKAISVADCRKMQIIVATHSTIPFKHPERFNFIETTKGYRDSVASLLD